MPVGEFGEFGVVGVEMRWRRPGGCQDRALDVAWTAATAVWLCCACAGDAGRCSVG